MTRPTSNSASRLGGHQQPRITLTDEQVLAAAAEDQFVNIVSAPGSGKTTVAAERFGYKRYRRTATRGVLGLSFTRSAAAELNTRIVSRWGSGCVTFPHCVTTFDELHVRLFQLLLDKSIAQWPNGHRAIEVFDDYRGFPGYRWLQRGSWHRFASLNDAVQVFSKADRITQPQLGISTAADHRAILNAGMCSHGDLRRLLGQALERKEIWSELKQWIALNYCEVVIDEVYDAAQLDLLIALMAAEAGLGVTVIGDPWQAVYGWRGATPDKVATLLEAGFVDYPLSQSFRFKGDHMPPLAQALREGKSVQLPWINSDDVDVALARQWQHLLPAGRNILPLAFRTISNQTDAALNLFLDLVTRANLSRPSFGREGAIVQLGLDRDEVQDKQEQVFRPILEFLVDGAAPDAVLDELRGAISSFGGRRPNRLSATKEKVRVEELQMLGDRLRRGNLIPGMTVHQAKGREWPRVGVVLSEQDAELLAQGLKPLGDQDCIIYVAITRAEQQCGRLGQGMMFEAGD